MELRASTADVPPAERFAFWGDMLHHMSVPVGFCSVRADDFHASARVVEIDTVQVSSLVCSSMQANRTQRLIRRSDPEIFHLALNLRGRSAVSQHGRDAVLDVDQFVLYESSHPFRNWGWADATGTHPGAGFLLQLPRALVPLPLDEVVRLTAVPLSARSGTGALVAAYLRELVRGEGTYRDADRSRLARITIDLVATMLAGALDIEDELAPETHYQALLAAIRADVHGRLGDPALSLDSVAARHHISRRTLNRVFQTTGSTMSEWILSQRLDRCRRDLIDPRLRTQPIHHIAAQWGFTSAAHFSRVFRAAYGLSPRDYRAQRRKCGASGQLSGAPGTASWAVVRPDWASPAAERIAPHGEMNAFVR